MKKSATGDEYYVPVSSRTLKKRMKLAKQAKSGLKINICSSVQLEEMRDCLLIGHVNGGKGCPYPQICVSNMTINDFIDSCIRQGKELNRLRRYVKKLTTERA